MSTRPDFRMSTRPAFLSSLVIAAAVVLLAGVLAWALARGPGLFSPGPLNAAAAAAPLGGVASHAALGSDCGACHPAPWSSATMADRCLDCHQGIGDRIAEGEGLHGRLAGTADAPTCHGCHPEHGGPQGALTVLDADAFPHEVTGFSLATHERVEEGDPVACGDCHPNDWAPFDMAVCTDCHAELDAAFMRRHAATWGEGCLPCHDGSGRHGAGFDHTTTGFELTGGHAGVACTECHAGARSAADLKATPNDCYSCHSKDDEHDGTYGRACGDCHTAESWDDVTFDHSVFPLDHGSEERTAACATCHPKRTTSYTCHGCHEHTRAKVLEQHDGQRVRQLKDCVRCHPGGEKAEN